MRDGRIQISAGARGKLRQWKRQCLARYERIMQVYANAACQKASCDFPLEIQQESAHQATRAAVRGAFRAGQDDGAGG
jgi:hypothetical protein